MRNDIAHMISADREIRRELERHRNRQLHRLQLLVFGLFYTRSGGRHCQGTVTVEPLALVSIFYESAPAGVQRVPSLARPRAGIRNEPLLRRHKDIAA